MLSKLGLIHKIIMLELEQIKFNLCKKIEQQLHYNQLINSYKADTLGENIETLKVALINALLITANAYCIYYLCNLNIESYNFLKGQI